MFMEFSLCQPIPKRFATRIIRGTTRAARWAPRREPGRPDFFADGLRTIMGAVTPTRRRTMPKLSLRQRPAAPAPAADSQDLARFGYRQELDRTLGSFSAFAAGFSYLSILTGMFQMFHDGFKAGGPAFFWTWPAVF